MDDLIYIAEQLVGLLLCLTIYFIFLNAAFIVILDVRRRKTGDKTGSRPASDDESENAAQYSSGWVYQEYDVARGAPKLILTSHKENMLRACQIYGWNPHKIKYMSTTSNEGKQYLEMLLYGNTPTVYGYFKEDVMWV